MFLQIKSHNVVIHELDIDKTRIDYVEDGNNILGLSIGKDGSSDHTVYPSPDFTFHIKGFSTALSPKTIKKIYDMPKPRSLSEVSQIIKDQA